jgi:hypothetical protein
MVSLNDKYHQVSEEKIAHLTDIAYQVVLERGFRGSFLELELSLWNAIRNAVDPSTAEHLARFSPVETV